MKASKVIYSEKDKQINNQIYQSFLNIQLDDGWNLADKVDNFKRFTEIVNFTKIALKNSTILDVGCGTGDLAFFLQKYQIKDYVGIDIFENSIIKANQKFPQYLFILSDFLTYSFDKKFDYVVCSGALTTKLSSDNYEIFSQWIIKMWELADIGVYFNILLEEYTGQNGGNLFLYNRERVLRICSEKLPSAKMKITTTNTGTGDYLYELHVYLYH